MKQRPPNLAPIWIALALGLCIGAAITGIYQRTIDPTYAAGLAPSLPRQQAGDVIRDFAGLHPPGERP